MPDSETMDKLDNNDKGISNYETEKRTSKRHLLFLQNINDPLNAFFGFAQTIW